MVSPAIKRVAIALVILIVALIFWEMWHKPEPAPVPAPAVTTPPQVVPEEQPTPTLPTEITVPALPPQTPAKKVQKSAVLKPKKTSQQPVAPMQTTNSTPPTTPSPEPIVQIPAPEPPAPLEWQGNDTSVTHPGEVVIRNDHQWVKFWSEHHPHEAAPDVDFSQSMVIGVFSGERPADQFTINILGTQTQNGHLVVTYQEKLPPPGTFAIGVSVYPYELKVIPQTTLPVKFNKLTPINPNQ